MSFFYLPDGRLRAGWRVLLGVIVAILANWIAAGISSVLTRRPGLFHFELIYRPLAMFLLIAGFSLLLIFADQVPDHLLRAQGLGGKRWAREFCAGLAIGAALIGIAVGIVASLGQLALRSTVTGRTAVLTLAVLFVLAAAAMTEELMFRGYPFQRLLEAVGTVPAILILSALFAYMHHLNPHASLYAMINTVTVGVLLAVAYLRTRALWLPWGIHLGWNATLGLLFGLPVSGLNFATAIKGTAAGPAWLTGGSYGLEASVVGTAVILLGFLPVLLLFHPAQGSSELMVPAAGVHEQLRPSSMEKESGEPHGSA